MTENDSNPTPVSNVGGPNWRSHVGSLLAVIEYMTEATGEGPDEEDAAMVAQINAEYLEVSDLHKKDSPVSSSGGSDPSIEPPPMWKPDNKSEIQPQTIDEWDWHKDAPENTPWLRSKKRLHTAACYADARAPDQMAMVLRVDLSRVIGRLTWLNARFGLESYSHSMHYQHRKGGKYEVVGIAKMQAEGWEDREYTGADEATPGASVDMRDVIVYRSMEDGSMWVRPRGEFEDGRFTALSTTATEGE